MALISRFKEVSGSARVRLSEVECDYLVVDDESGQPVLVLRTMGASGRRGGRRPSQVVELDRPAALTLARIIRETFPDINN